jgi:hypothetical protein
MIHIGTVHLNGHEYSLDLNRAEQPRNESKGEPPGAAARRNFPTSRSELVLLNHKRKAIGAQNTSRPIPTVRPIEDLHRVTQLTRKEQAQPPVASQTRWKVDRDRLVKLISHFLSWCFPVREFSSPLQRILYLSVEGPKTKYRRRISLR